MIYKEVFDLRGTEQQQQIVIEALEAIKFPFERIKFPKGTAIIGWANLNTAMMEKQFNDPNGPIFHIGDHPATDKDTESIEGFLEGRKYVFGVFYPSSGNIYIDSYLTNYPSYAKTTVSAEIAHGADEFLPMTEAQRNSIIDMMHRGTSGHVDCTWWEKVDYGAEYYNLVGESFMGLFTYAYSDMPFEGAFDFSHTPLPTMAQETRDILGIQRTDYVAPTPAPEAPVEPPAEDGTPPQPTPDSGDTGDDVPTPLPVEEFVRYGKSKVYHLPTHYKNKTNGIVVEDTEGLRICKICQKTIDKRATVV
jgi:hypothetical protein